MTFWSGFIVGVVSVCILLLVGSIINNPAQLQPGKYVTCSDYSLITDKYKTLDGFYVVANNLTIPVVSWQYDKFFIGGYIKNEKAFGSVYMTSNLTQSNESESGYRGACKVLP